MSPPVVLIATVKLRRGQEEAFAAWQLEQDKAVSRFEGYISSDIMAPTKPGDNEWTILLNFRSKEDLVKWQRSDERAQLIGKALPLLEGGNLGELMPKDNSAAQPGSNVTQVILSKVKPGMEEPYREWAVRIQRAQALYPGYRGTYLQPPENDRNGYWTTMLRYDTQEHLNAWLESPERAELIREAKAFIENEELLRLATSFPGWVPIDPTTGEGPPNWKTALLVLLGLFPTVMLELRYLNPHLAFLNPSAATFIGNIGSVAVTSFITMPLFVRWFGWWLFPKQDAPASTSAKGVLILTLLFAGEIAALWHLF